MFLEVHRSRRLSLPYIRSQSCCQGRTSLDLLSLPLSSSSALVGLAKMFRHENTNDTPNDSTQSRPPSPTRPDSGPFDWSPAPTSRAPSLDDPSPPYPSAPPPISINLNRRRTSSPRASQPQVLLNMPLIQAQAEILEAQTRRDMEETQRLAERHFEEMLDSRGFRVTHACEHCRQRKAKVSFLQFFAGSREQKGLLTRVRFV